MNYNELRSVIKEYSNTNFVSASNNLQEILFEIDKKSLLSIIAEIGIIPEDIEHDSSEEKLYTKVSDILFAKSLKEMNFEVEVIRERSNCADIIAQSKFHNYSFVGDAKAFRLSRTAKNVKDFKIDSMVHWRGDNDYSVLACPYFQYPKSNSQIYKLALEGNVSLFSWEYLYIVLSENIMENETINLQELWNQSHIIMQQTNMADSSKCFIKYQDENIKNILDITDIVFNNHFDNIKKSISARGNKEINYYQSEINRVNKLNKKEAIKELLLYMKLDSKIETIRKFINQIEK